MAQPQGRYHDYMHGQEEMGIDEASVNIHHAGPYYVHSLLEPKPQQGLRSQIPRTVLSMKDLFTALAADIIAGLVPAEDLAQRELSVLDRHGFFLE